jgi:hypothetical protein
MALGGKNETACLTQKQKVPHLISTTHHQANGLSNKSLRPTQIVEIIKDICSMVDN